MKKEPMDMTKRVFKILALATSLALIIGMISVTTSSAKTAQEINSEVNAALELFLQQVKGGKEFLNAAKGVLIIPNIVKVGVDMVCFPLTQPSPLPLPKRLRAGRRQGREG